MLYYSGSPETEEQRLLADIFENYSTVARPVIDPLETVTVFLELALTKLDRLVSLGYELVKHKRFGHGVEGPIKLKVSWHGSIYLA